MARFVRPDWEPGTGAPIEDAEPATGRLIATVTGSTPDDVARAAAAAKAAQPAWAETCYQERARILRRAAEIYEQHRAEFGTWTMRETGASHSKMHHEQNFTRGRDPRRGDDAVAAVRLARADRVTGPAVDGPPGASRRRRRDHPVELAERAGHARRRAGTRAGQRRRPQARSADAGHAAGRCSRPSSGRPGLPDGLLQIVIGDAEVGEALVTDPNIDVVIFTGSTEAGRRVGAMAGAC